jgi:hypothetical protein
LNNALGSSHGPRYVSRVKHLNRLCTSRGCIYPRFVLHGCRHGACARRLSRVLAPRGTP